jgi:hypothetical protein
MKKLKLNAWGEKQSLGIYLDNYTENGNLYVGLVCCNKADYGEPWSDLTVNLGVKLAPNKAYIDINDNGNEIVNWLVANKLGKPTGNIFCTYPEFEFDMNELKKYIMA